MGNRVRLSDVAKRAEVGVGTVSRVLNRSAKVSAITRKKVLDAIAELGYRPNLVARGLAANRTGLIAAIIPEIGYTQHSEIILGMTDVLHANEMNLMIGTCGYLDGGELQVIEAFLDRRPDAIYVTGVRHTEAVRTALERSGIPVVEGGNLTDHPIDTVVGYSNFNASADLTRLLIDRGYRRIWHVTVNKDSNNGRAEDRLEGFQRATSTEGGLEVNVIRCENSFDGGAEAVRLVTASGVKVEALTFATDVMAVGGLLECHRRGIVVPERLAIAGFGDLAIARSINPSLTTVKIDRVGLGRKAAEIIVSRLQGNDHSSQIVDVGFEVVERESTRRSDRAAHSSSIPQFKIFPEAIVKTQFEGSPEKAVCKLGAGPLPTIPLVWVTWQRERGIL
ncbi:LacI family DNA-binding transcriptional regulator [Sinorhizobium meliloti]|uniref:LacI family DNA-binding transcriptional regulator n=3 Tax=Rhizobium meliloti TaxID=382 RepID=UPI000404F2E0|nr:LacI family DNA-binding transcriptional regulator [Sinorhizobium meliloti]MCM5687835.1 LacI family DNA-binding transcriptional regulator [Sinorhizobium meliloti]TWA89081.1 LacI family transcriptional regulator [Ensifer sp. SEMIA 134]TWB25153.1 LacI family transcriptional regulator [Ensifer sp. SEMIA 135]